MPEQLILGPKFDAKLSGITVWCFIDTNEGSIQKKNKNVAPSSETKINIINIYF